MVSWNNVFTFCLSRASASFTVSITLTLNIIRPVFLIHALILLIIRSRFLRIFLVNHLKAGSLWSLLQWTYSANSIGFVWLTNDIGTQSEDSSFYPTWISQPFVVIVGFFLHQLWQRNLCHYLPQRLDQTKFRLFLQDMHSPNRLDQFV